MNAWSIESEFLVAIDSDGCAFDTMELKHKECFIPNTIRYYDLQPVSKYAREAAEFVNLYSVSRGINRFPALIETLQWLQRRPDVTARNVAIEVPQSVCDWTENETKLGNPALKEAVDRTGDAELARALEWSLAVNATIKDMVQGVPPFPGVKEALSELLGRADQVVCSATPNEALQAEWSEHGIEQFVSAICGQETGTKKETLANARAYKPRHALMVGDAPGDFQAAEANECLFFPICPGEEGKSWRQFIDEAIPRFFNGTFDVEYQAELLARFNAVLPVTPPWPVVTTEN